MNKEPEEPVSYAEQFDAHFRDDPYRLALYAYSTRRHQRALQLVEQHPFPYLSGPWFQFLRVLIISNQVLGRHDESARHLAIHQAAAAVRPWYCHHTVALAHDYISVLGDTEGAIRLLDSIVTDDPWVLREIATTRLIAKLQSQPGNYDEQFAYLSSFVDVGPESLLVTKMTVSMDAEEPLHKLQKLLTELKTRATDRHQMPLDSMLMNVQSRLDKLHGRPWTFEEHKKAQDEIYARYGVEKPKL